MTHFVLQITVNLFENLTLNDALLLTIVIEIICNYSLCQKFEKKIKRLETKHFELQISMKSFENSAHVTYFKTQFEELINSA